MAEITEITSGLRFPEGPVAMPDGSVLVVEIERRTLTRVWPDGRQDIVARAGGGPNGLAIGPDNAAFVTNNGGFTFHEDQDGVRPTTQAVDYDGGRLERVDLATGEVTVLTAETGTGHRLKGPNDLVVDREGGIWFTDLGKRRARDLDYGGVYWLSPDRRTIREIAHPFLTPNGIGLSPDEKTLYVAETEGARLWAFDITGPGEIRRHPWPSPHGGRLLYAAGGALQRYDSLAVEACGNICVATLLEGGITVVSPEGRLVEFVPMPDRYTTNICFGGPNLRTAYITLSQGGRLVAMNWPRAGLPLNFLNRREGAL
ncbi:SMP-30/gluconolactonase/LRE family protein [Marinimicrococcus flavescens]|uniref:SMP-30/gluconolactonase/LRE family protein n=1 Tax=Marinimicrococcus flavescens TaxID=3031815 RepID=A0AAP3XQW6_9PROT|nr:SMP-30/gluconolactonase/LRE family protein [Marinimicrococcus flavescens]